MESGGAAFGEDEAFQSVRLSSVDDSTERGKKLDGRLLEPGDLNEEKKSVYDLVCKYLAHAAQGIQLPAELLLLIYNKTPQLLQGFIDSALLYSANFTYTPALLLIGLMNYCRGDEDGDSVKLKSFRNFNASMLVLYLSFKVVDIGFLAEQTRDPQATVCWQAVKELGYFSNYFWLLYIYRAISYHQSTDNAAQLEVQGGFTSTTVSPIFLTLFLVMGGYDFIQSQLRYGVEGSQSDQFANPIMPVLAANIVSLLMHLLPLLESLLTIAARMKPIRAVNASSSHDSGKVLGDLFSASFIIYMFACLFCPHVCSSASRQEPDSLGDARENDVGRVTVAACSKKQCAKLHKAELTRFYTGVNVFILLLTCVDHYPHVSFADGSDLAAISLPQNTSGSEAVTTGSGQYSLSYGLFADNLLMTALLIIALPPLVHKANERIKALLTGNTCGSFLSCLSPAPAWSRSSNGGGDEHVRRIDNRGAAYDGQQI